MKYFKINTIISRSKAIEREKKREIYSLPLSDSRLGGDFKGDKDQEVVDEEGGGRENARRGCNVSGECHARGTGSAFLTGPRDTVSLSQRTSWTTHAQPTGATFLCLLSRL